jgi:phage/plasmid-like protein (TIGR03299 family)
MSHALTLRANGFTEFASTQAGSWHGLGQQLARGASIDEWATAAGMDWRIQRGVVRFATGRDQGADQWAEMPEQHVLMRSDTKAPLAIVSDGFKVVQPRQILETLAHSARVQGYELETAGTLFGGRRFWALASFEGEGDDIVPGDRVNGYTLLVTATDGTLKTTGKKTTVRVVCNNTLSMAMGAGAATMAVSHRTTYSADKMAAALGLVHGAEFAEFTDKARRLADKQLSRDRAERIAFDLLKPATVTDNVQDIEKVTDSLAFKRIMALFNGDAKGAAIDGVKGTAWGFLNSVTEYCDFHMRATTDDNRRNSAWFGAGDALKDKAAGMLVALA